MMIIVMITLLLSSLLILLLLAQLSPLLLLVRLLVVVVAVLLLLLLVDYLLFTGQLFSRSLLGARFQDLNPRGTHAAMWRSLWQESQMDFRGEKIISRQKNISAASRENIIHHCVRG